MLPQLFVVRTWPSWLSASSEARRTAHVGITMRVCVSPKEEKHLLAPKNEILFVAYFLSGNVTLPPAASVV